MKMYTKTFDTMDQLVDFVNKCGISKDMIVNVYQSAEKDFTLVYYAE